MKYKRYTQLPVLLDMLTHRRLTLLDPSTWEDRNDRYFLEQYASRKEVPGVLAMCLTKASATFHHWHVFAGKGPSGVRVEFKRDPFEAWVEKHKGRLQLRKVEYVRLNKVDSVQPKDLPFVKRHAFRDEGEVRLIAHKEQAEDASRSFGIKLSMIEEVILSPWLAVPLQDAVIQAIGHAAGGATIKVRPTTMLENQRFKDLAGAHEAD